MCRGKSEEKAEFLVDIILGEHLKEDHKEKYHAKPKEPAQESKGAFHVPNMHIDMETVGLGKKEAEDVINYKNPRLVLAMKHLIYFSEIFPKKYMKNYLTVTT